MIHLMSISRFLTSEPIKEKVILGELIGALCLVARSVVVSHSLPQRGSSNAKVLLQSEIPGVSLLRLRVRLLDIPVVC